VQLTSAESNASKLQNLLMLLPRRLVLERRRPCDDTEPPRYYPRRLPRALAAMPALRELELNGVDCLSAAPEQELSAAARPALSALTSLSVSIEADSRFAATALYLWLRWALPAAVQLRKLSVMAPSARDPSQGLLVPLIHGCACILVAAAAAAAVIAVAVAVAVLQHCVDSGCCLLANWGCC